MNGTRKRKPEKTSKLDSGRYGYLFCLPYLLTYVAFGLFPILFTLFISFTDWNGVSPMKFIGLQNYLTMFEANYSYLLSLKNTIVIMLLYIPADMICGLLLAYAMYSSALKWKGFFRVVNLMPYITSSVALGIMFMILFDFQIGGVNSLLTALGVIQEPVYWLGHAAPATFVVSLSVFWRWLGYYMVMYLAGLTNISDDIVEAARIDGASERQLFFHISIPLIRPTIVFLLITSIVGGFQLMEEPMIIFKSTSGAGSVRVGGPGRSVLTAVWNIYDTAFQTKMKYGVASAMSYGLFLIIAVFAFLGFRVMTRKEDDT